MPITPTNPPVRKSRHVDTNIIELAYEVKEANTPGQWYMIRTYDNRGTAVSQASRMRLKPHAKFPSGQWEIMGKENDEGNGSELYVCFHGEAEGVEIVNKPRRGFITGAFAEVAEGAVSVPSKTVAVSAPNGAENGKGLSTEIPASEVHEVTGDENTDLTTP